MSAPDRPPAAYPFASEGGEAPPRLLIVDDTLENRNILARRFQRRGFEIVEAEGGYRALELIAEQKFDLVLLDWMMPDLEGVEVLSRIRQSYSQVALPVIMATAKAQSEDVVQALRLGANDYIIKPVDFAVALTRIEAQIGRKRAEEKVWRANEALARMNEELERRIDERTADLRDANLQLQTAMEQAQAANRAKDEFLTNMSHEFRTPLNGVAGVAQVLASGPLDPRQKEMVEIIESSAMSLDNVLTGLLDMIDLQSGLLNLQREVFAPGEIARKAAAFPAMQARQKGLAFTVDVAPEAEADVEGDPSRLRQILLNLLNNAIKFTERGEVRLHVRRGGASAPDNVILEVHDTGPGFDAAVAERMFERFSQADGSLTRRFGGVGVGLTICRDLAQRMGGTVTAQGRPGQGAMFRIELPLPRLHAPREPGPTSPHDSSSLHVLCAEDHPVNRKLLEFIMDAAGIGLTAVENGAQALEAYKAQAFDAVLMDMQMPVMDGLQATRAIREFEAAHGRAATPVIMITAHCLPDHLAASREAGADRHVAKPIVAVDLLECLTELVPAKHTIRAA